MRSDTVDFGAADLSNCDREPIHIPGSIQPHGALLVVDRKVRRIEQVAGDTSLLLGKEADEMVGLDLDAVFDDATLGFISSHLDDPAVRIAPLLRLDVLTQSGSLPLDLTLSAIAATAILEIEPSRRASTSAGDPLAQLKLMLAALDQTSDVAGCCAAAAATLRQVTGFDRAMVYRFEPDGSGVVIAESLRPGMEPFLGLHYPASDIPSQARRLYTTTWLRAIPNVGYEPATLRPAVDPGADPVDMSQCGLRSVSPLHLEYLRNMGVGATLTLSIMCRGTLWGMLVLHHRSARFLGADLRVACETFAQIFSLQVEARRLVEESTLRLEARRLREQVVTNLISAPEVASALASETLMQYVRADGVAAFVGGTLRTFGMVPGEADLMELMKWLSASRRVVFFTEELAVTHPQAAAYARVGSGLLAIGLTREPHDYVLWFRAEYSTTVRWAGDPSKPVAVEKFGTRLTPRGSFAEWRQLMCGRSLPWSTVDIESAEALRVVLLEHVLKAVDAARRAREKAFQRQNLLLAELDHRVKNALGKIESLIVKSRTSAVTVQSFATTLQHRIQAMLQTHTLLSEGRWVGTTLRRLCEDDLAPMTPDRRARVTLTGEDIFVSPLEALALSMVLDELTMNAVHHGALSGERGTVCIRWDIDPESNTLRIDWREAGGAELSGPLKPGAGMELIKRTVEQELHGTAIFDTHGGALHWLMQLPAGDPGLR